MLGRLNKASIAIIVLGLLASLAGGAFTINLVTKNSRLAEDVAVARASQILQSSILLAEARLQAIAGYFSVERTVTPTEFVAFTSRLSSIQIVKGLQFVRIVPDADLEQYVKGQRAFRPGFNISDKTEDARLIPGQSRDLHYVIEFISPVKGNEAAIGLDIATNPVALKSLERAISIGQTAMSNSFKLVQNKGELALLMYAPVYRDKDASISVIGVAAGLISLDRIAQEVTSDRAVLLSIRNKTSGIDLIPVKPAPDGYSSTSTTIDLPGNTVWQIGMAAQTQGSPQAAGLLVFGLGTLLTLLALGGLEQARLQTRNRQFGVRLTASEQTLAAREAAYRGLFENASTANVEVDLQTGEIVRANEAIKELTGQDPDGIVGRQFVEMVHPKDQDSLTSALTSKLTSTEGLPGIELRLQQNDGNNIWVLASIGESSEAVSGQPCACVVMQDISKRKKADEARDLLVRELAHRVRNTMQLIGSLADQTARTARDVPSFVRNFKGRLLALNSAQDALFDANWGPVRADLLVPRILEPFETEGRQHAIHTEIEQLTLLPQEAQTIALALHELANNASRHGALKSPRGAVELTITSHAADGETNGKNRVLLLTWEERGGDQIVSAPETTGFGSIMLERLLARQHGGESRFHWEPDGLKFEATLPLANPIDIDTDKKY